MSPTNTADRRFQVRDLTHIALFAVLMTACAWISIPMPKPLVPFTLQTFAMFAALITLGGCRGFYAIVVYLLLGAVGLPVFAGFQGGPGALLGTTGGYLIGFLASALVYWAITAHLGTGLKTVFLACVAGLAVCYAFGTAWFLFVYARTTGPIGLMTALGWCVFPFIGPDLIKIGLAVFLSRKLPVYLRRSR